MQRSKMIRAANRLAYRRDLEARIRKSTCGRFIETGEYRYSNWLAAVEAIALLIAAGEFNPVIGMHDTGIRHAGRLTKHGKSLLLLLRQYADDFHQYSHVDVANPLTMAMVDVVEQHWDEVRFRVCHDPDGRDFETQLLLFKIVREWNVALQSEAVQQGIGRARRSERRNLASMLSYVRALFRANSKLLIVRVDLYHPDLEFGRSKEAQLILERYLRRLRADLIVPEVLGYVIKREEGPERGVHYHLLVCQNGHKHCDAKYMGEALGNEWERMCGQGHRQDRKEGLVYGNRGTYFNCWSRRRDYRYNALGVLSHNDRNGLTGLRETLRYICKEGWRVGRERAEGEQQTELRGWTRDVRRGLMPRLSRPKSLHISRSPVVDEVLQLKYTGLSCAQIMNRPEY